MAQTDYYEVLGVSKQGTEEDIRRAFRKKAMEFHPDRNKEPGAEDKFKEINEAYQVLSDSTKRAQYDRFGHAGVNGGSHDRPFDGFDGFGGFGDIFESFFGEAGARRSRAPQRGSDLQQQVVLEFEEAAFGVERELDVSRVEICHRCSGAGNEPGTSISTCGTCGGNGQVRRTQRSVFGQFAQVTTCPTCQGRGTTMDTPCSNCRGVGMERRTRKTVVNIPAGIQDGMQVRLTGEGNAGANGGPPGNLYIQVEVKRHRVFQRDEYDLLYILSLNVAEASLGAEKQVPTLEGDTTTLRIPGGTQHGAEFRVRGKGIPHVRGGRKGDLRVYADVNIPNRLSRQQKKLLEELARTFDPDYGKETPPYDDETNRDVLREEAGDPVDDVGLSEEDGGASGKEKGLFDRIKDVLT